jgi:hypothetical protein
LLGALQAKSHPALDGRGWQGEFCGDLGVGELAVFGERDHLYLSVGKPGQRGPQSICVVTLDDFSRTSSGAGYAAS